MEIALSSPLSLGHQMNPQHLALHPPSLCLKPIKISSSLPITTNNGRGRRRRRRRPTIGPFKMAAASFKRAASFAMSLRDLLSQTTAADPLNLLLLHYGGSGGGGGGGGPGLPTGGSSGGGDWFGKRRRGRFKFKGIFGFLLFSISLASVIFEVGEEKKKEEEAADWELGVRVLVPAALGFKIRVWRNWVGLGLTMALGVVSCYILLRPSGEKNRRP